MPLANAELPMRPPEFLQVRHETITVGLALLGIGDPARGLEETPSLRQKFGTRTRAVAFAAVLLWLVIDATKPVVPEDA